MIPPPPLTDERLNTELYKLLEARAAMEWISLSRTLAQCAALAPDACYWFTTTIWDDLRAWLLELRGTSQDPI